MDLLFKNPRYFFDTYFNVPLWEFLLVWVVGFGILCMIEQRVPAQERWWDMLCAFVITLVLTVCLLNRSRAHGRMLVLNLCGTLVRLIHGDIHTVRQLGSNLLLFIPVGIVFRLRWNMLQSVAMGMALSVCIEILQYCFAVGITEVTDVLVNTSGTMIGAGLIFAFFN